MAFYVLFIHILSTVCGIKAPKHNPLFKNKFYNIVHSLGSIALGGYVAHKVNAWLADKPEHKKTVARIGYSADVVATLYSLHTRGDWSFEGNPILRYIGSNYGTKAAITALVALSEAYIQLADKDSIHLDILSYTRSMAVFSHIPSLFLKKVG